MKYLKYFESYKDKKPEIIDIPISDDEDLGGVYGVIHFKKEYLDNWFYLERVELNIDENLIEFPVAILKNKSIDEVEMQSVSSVLKQFNELMDFKISKEFNKKKSKRKSITLVKRLT